jgi:predicted transposase YbfD/YdcC
VFDKKNTPESSNDVSEAKQKLRTLDVGYHDVITQAMYIRTFKLSTFCLGGVHLNEFIGVEVLVELIMTDIAFWEMMPYA